MGLLFVFLWMVVSMMTYYICIMLFDIQTDNEEWAALCVSYIFWWMILPAILVVMTYRGLVMLFGKFHAN